jgi:zinc D-Ala-D-Ala carboxypeptidase
MAETSWRYFTPGEVQCRCGCLCADMDAAFMARLDALRDALQHPLRVSSGYRCPSHNTRVSQTGATGPHTTGQAVDLAVAGPLAFTVVALALRLGFTGIGVAQKGSLRGRFVHVDDLADGPGCPRPRIWSY